jgi:hypothetical protein
MYSDGKSDDDLQVLKAEGPWGAEDDLHDHSMFNPHGGAPV